MITGELEQEIERKLQSGYGYDDFKKGWFKRKKPPLTQEQRDERRSRRENTLKDLGSFGNTLKDTVSLFRPAPPVESQETSSYEFGLDNAQPDRPTNDPPKDDETPIEWYALGFFGVVIAGLVIYKAVKNKKGSE